VVRLLALHPTSPLFPYATLFRSQAGAHARRLGRGAPPPGRHRAGRSQESGGARTQAAVEMTRPVLTQIGKYPVLRKLGEGGTSEVYLCNDPFTARDVAIKVAFPEQFQDPDRGKRYKKLFLTEASLSGKLHHPHICQIY